jgi:hypothetical protein
MYDDFSWTKYMIFGEDAALSYDDSETRQKKQDWAQYVQLFVQGR